jgi:hypothetical protein
MESSDSLTVDFDAAREPSSVPPVPASRKPQLGWRLPTAELSLFTPLFRLAEAEEMFTIEYGQDKRRWEDFNDLLFCQPVFRDHGKTSVQAIKNQFNARIEAFKRKHGWEDGKTTNLSGEAGDLCEVDHIIKAGLKAQYDAKEAKRAKEADKEACDTIPYAQSKDWCLSP